jgi:hypothetical protein
MYSQVDTEKVHHPIHILYGAIALAIVVWSVLYYQVKNAPQPITVVEDINPPPSQQGLTEAEKISLQAALDQKFPPKELTDSERKALEDGINKSSKPTPLTEEEKRALEENLNSKQ